MQIDDESKISLKFKLYVQIQRPIYWFMVSPSKGTVARLTHSIDFLESNEEHNAKERDLIGGVIDECLETVYRMRSGINILVSKTHSFKKYAIIW